MQSSSTANPKRRTSLHAPGILLSVLLMLVILPSQAASQCPGSQCIRPQPMPAPLALGEAELDTALIALRCELVCIKEVRLHVCMQHLWQYLAMGLFASYRLMCMVTWWTVIAWLKCFILLSALAWFRKTRARTFKACLVVWGFNRVSKH